MSSAVPSRVRVLRPVLPGRDRMRLAAVPRRRTQAPRVPFVTLVTLMLVGGVVGLLLFNTSMQQASFASTELERQATALGLRQQTLQLQLQRMRDPERLARQADAMGMRLEGAPLFLHLGTGRVLGERPPAGASTGLRIRDYPAQRPDSLVPNPVVVESITRGTARPGNSTPDTAAASPGGRAPTGRNG